MFYSSTRISLSTLETMTFSLKIMTQTLQKTLKWLLLAIGDSKKRLEEKTSKEDAKFDVVARIFEEVFFVNSTKKCILICLVSNLSCTDYRAYAQIPLLSNSLEKQATSTTRGFQSEAMM